MRALGLAVALALLLAGTAVDALSDIARRLVLQPTLPSTNETLIKVGILVPLTPVWTMDAFREFPAVALAVAEKRGWFPNHTVELLIHDDGCDFPQLGVQSALHLMLQEKVVALFGATCSVASVAVSQVAQTYEVPQLSADSTSNELSDKSLHPYFSRSIIPGKTTQEAAIQLARAYDWRKVGVLAPGDSYGADLMRQFSVLSKRYNVTVSFQLSYPPSSTAEKEEVEEGLSALLRTDMRIFFAYGSAMDAWNVLTYAYKQGLMGQGYAWIIEDTAYADAMLNDWFGDPIYPKAMEGTLVVTSEQPSHDTPEFIEMAQTHEAVWNKPVTDPSNTARYYDGVLALLKGISNLLAAGGDPYDGEQMLASIRAVDLIGAFGHLKFDPETGDPIGTRLVGYNILADGDLAHFATYTQGQSQGWTFESGVSVLFSGGTNVVPVDTLVFKEIGIGEGVQLTFFLLTGAAALLTLIVSVVVVRYRNHPLIKASTFPFRLVILFGILWSLAVVPLFVLTPTNEVCSTIVWTAQLSFVTIMGSLFVVAWRIYRLFRAGDRLQSVKIGNWFLAGLLLVLYLLQVLILVLWQGLDPPMALYVRDESQRAMFWRCSFASNSEIFPGLVLGSDAILLVFGAFLAYESTKIPAEYQYASDAKEIAAATYNYLVLAVAMGIVLSALSDKPEGFASVACSMFLLLALGTLVAMFGPRLVAVLRSPGMTSETRYSSRMGKTQIPMTSPATTMPKLERKDSVVVRVGGLVSPVTV